MAIEIGAGISSGIAEQIEARKKIIGKTSGRTDEDLMYMNAKTGWVKLSSGVNTLSEDEVAQFRRQEGRKDIRGGNGLAKENVLFGGILKPSEGLREGLDTSGNVNTDKAYLLRPSTGFRPMAGITSMTVKSKNTYGTLREAEVSFSVWSLEEFEVMERLYLRPGFTMLLEWGHSLYINNSGKLQKTIETISPGLFFRSNQQMSNITDAIKEVREKSNYNYDGMVGYCKNFSWKYNSNGGYDCTVSITSAGEVIESLTMKTSPSYMFPPSEMEPKESEAGKEQRKSVFHYFLSKLAALKGTTLVLKPSLQGIAPTFTTPLQEFCIFFSAVEIDDSWFSDTETPMHWVSLRTILDIYNNWVAVKDLTKAPGSKNATMTKFNIDPANRAEFVTGPKHFSPDPTVCVLIAPNDEGLGVLGPVHGSITSLEEGADRDVLNILIATPYLKTKFDEALDSDGKFNKSFLDVLKSILDGLADALGGINDFDVAYDEEENGGTFYVVDRNLTPKSPPVELTLVGIDSIFREVGISSKISNETASQIAIAAQGTTQNYTENVENILKWNPNIIDRIIVTKDVTPKNKKDETEVKEEEEKNLLDWKDSIKKFFTDFEGGGYEKDELNASKTEHQQYTVENVIRKPGSGTGAAPGPIPVELSIKLDGIGGIKIASTFRISKGILPEKYNGKFGYIVTGVEHSVNTSNVWETTVTSQFYLLEQLKQAARQPQTVPPYTAPSPKAEAAAGYTPPGPIQPGDDPAPIINPKKVGAGSYNASPLVANSKANGGQNGILNQANPKLLVYTGDGGAKSYYKNPATGKPEYMLHPAANRAWQAWKADMKAAGISYRLTSAYRSQVHQAGLGTGKTVAKPGSSPHGWGGALDFGNLYQIVGGSGDPQRNVNGRKTPIYKQMATLGAKHGWYNPWRLSDVNGVDELWHFEYWGPA
jgi:hypothetical protein